MQSDQGNLLSPDPRRAAASPLSRPTSPPPTRLAGQQQPPPASAPIAIASGPQKGPEPPAVAVTATAEGAALPVVGSPEQYLLRAKNVPPRPGEVATVGQGNAQSCQGCTGLPDSCTVAFLLMPP